MSSEAEQKQSIEQKKQAVEDAIQDYLRAEFTDNGGSDEAALIVTDWSVAYNARQMQDGKDYSAIGSFSSNHSSVATLLGLAAGLYERMKARLLS